MAKLVILRGRPGSGKSTVAERIQEKINNQKAAIFTPDYFYWQVYPGEDNQHLVNQVLNYAIKKYLQSGYLVILEGILPKSENGELFKWLQKYCRENNFEFNSFFLDLSLPKAIERNKQREKGTEISDEDIKNWYSNASPKEIKNEIVINTENISSEKVTDTILEKIIS